MALDTPKIVFEPTIEDFVKSRKAKPLTILSGLNNSGKSYVLTQAAHSHGKDALYFGCNRFFTLDKLQSQAPQPEYLEGIRRDFEHSIRQGTHNIESNGHRFEQVLRGLNDGERDNLFNLFTRLMGVEISLQHELRNNSMTPVYVEIDGEPLKYTSSGTRLLLGLLGTCMDSRFHQIFIDEPELGLSPKIQSIIGKFFRTESLRSEFIPHLKNVYIATHSHLFLDPDVIKNNFIVSKEARTIRINQVSTIAEYQHLQFTLLGNDLESLFMPSAIVMVEGPSDEDFFNAVLKLRFPNRRITVIWGGGDGEIPKLLGSLMNAFGGLDRSPYRNRIFPVLDSENTTKTERLVSKGIDRNNITEWKKNGIEFYYPRDIMRKHFYCDDSSLDQMTCTKTHVTCNERTEKKTELAKEVCRNLTSESKFHEDFENLLQKISSATE